MRRKYLYRSVILVAMAPVPGVPAIPAAAVEIDVDASAVEQLRQEGVTRGELARLYPRLTQAESLAPDCVEGEEMFTDVPFDGPFCPWIEELARRSITSGCTATEYCPGQPVTRAQMAAFILKATAPAGWIVDDIGEYVGEVVELGTDTHYLAQPGGIPTVAVEIAGKSILFRLLSPNDLRMNRTVYYRGAGCTGEAKVAVGIIDKLRGEVFATGVGTDVLAGYGEQASQFYQSWARDSGCQESGGTTGAETWVVEPVFDLAGMFTPPFHLKF